MKKIIIIISIIMISVLGINMINMSNNKDKMDYNEYTNYVLLEVCTKKLDNYTENYQDLDVVDYTINTQEYDDNLYYQFYVYTKDGSEVCISKDHMSIKDIDLLYKGYLDNNRE